MDTKKIQALKDQHGDIYELEAGDVVVYAKAPSRPTFKRWLSISTDEKKRYDGLEVLLRDCVVEPAGEKLDELLDRKPGLAATFGAKLLELAGAQEEASFRKV